MVCISFLVKLFYQHNPQFAKLVIPEIEMEMQTENRQKNQKESKNKLISTFIFSYT